MYHTTFTGRVEVSPPLNAAEVSYLTQFNRARHWDRPTGPYHLSESGGLLHGFDRSMRSNRVDPNMPGFYCPWKPTEDGTALVWDGGEKPYAAVEWMGFLVHHFLRPEAIAKQELTNPPDPWEFPKEFDRFTWDHVCTGVVHAHGGGESDAWSLLVTANNVTHVNGHAPAPRMITVVHSRAAVSRVLETFAEADRRAAARQKVLAPAWAALEEMRAEYPGVDLRHMLDVALSALLQAGFTVTAPDGETRVWDGLS